MGQNFKITVIKKFCPKDVFGDLGFSFDSGKKDKICNLFEEGQKVSLKV